MTTDSFIEDTYSRIREAIINIDVNQFPDIYVISFYNDNIDDDPRRPTLTVGFNTLNRFRDCTPSPGQKEDYPIASGADEAKWNYAFWLQNEELMIGGYEYDPVSGWVEQLPFYYTDEQAKEDFDKSLEPDEKIRKQFVEIMIAHAKKLHDEGIIRKKFGKDIPIIIHELEYYDAPLDWTKRANPKGLVREFEDWINSLYSKL